MGKGKMAGISVPPQWDLPVTHLGVTHAEKPWSQKELESIGGNLSVYHIS